MRIINYCFLLMFCALRSIFGSSRFYASIKLENKRNIVIRTSPFRTVVDAAFISIIIHRRYFLVTYWEYEKNDKLERLSKRAAKLNSEGWKDGWEWKEKKIVRVALRINGDFATDKSLIKVGRPPSIAKSVVDIWQFDRQNRIWSLRSYCMNLFLTTWSWSHWT